MTVVAELRPAWKASASLAADPGRFVPPGDIILDGLTLALVELPDLAGDGLNPAIYLAASSTTPTWKRASVQISNDHFSLGASTARRKAVIGSAETLLGDGAAGAIDTLNSVEVLMVDPTHWLISCDDDALAGGANLALVGDELLQFADVEPISPGRFRLSRLMRGRYATEDATGTHAGGDQFLLVDPSSLQRISLPASARGTVVTVTCHATGSEVSATRLVDGRSLRTGLFIGGEQIVGSRAAGIPDPSGGTTVDAEARGTVGEILDALRRHGLIET